MEKQNLLKIGNYIDDKHGQWGNKLNYSELLEHADKLIKHFSDKIKQENTGVIIIVSLKSWTLRSTKNN